MYASTSDNTDLIAYLLDRGADIDARDEVAKCFFCIDFLIFIETIGKQADGETALMWAARYDFSDAVTTLLDRGADIYAESHVCSCDAPYKLISY
jgi:ankyrin repeat protein